jgi:hypothetical protein
LKALKPDKGHYFTPDFSKTMHQLRTIHLLLPANQPLKSFSVNPFSKLNQKKLAAACMARN